MFFYLILLVNGTWGEWSTYGECSKTCGVGEQTKSRLCNNPEASYGGLQCLKSHGNGNRGTNETLSRRCNTQACPGNFLPYHFSSHNVLYVNLIEHDKNENISSHVKHICGFSI